MFHKKFGDFLMSFLFFMNLCIFRVKKIKKNSYGEKKNFKIFVRVDYIFLNTSAKNQVKIPKIEFFRGGVMAQT